MLTDPHVRQTLGDGLSMTVATTDAEGMPTTCRTVGARILDDSTLVVYLPIAIAAKTVANLATNGRIALVSSDVISHRTVQVKGRSRKVRVAHESERQAIEAWHAAFAENVSQVGMPRRLSLGITTWPAFAIEIEISQVFEQTPGPKAGTLVRQR